MSPEALPRLYGSEDRIRKRVEDLAVQPHLLDWDTACRNFDWAQARRAMAGLPGGALNIAMRPWFSMPMGRMATGSRSAGWAPTAAASASATAS